MDNSIIEIEKVTKKFTQNKTVQYAVDNISFNVQESEVFGLLGPNGAGKTTTIKMLTTLLIQSSGTIRVLGYDSVKESKKIRMHINFVYGGERGVYGRLTSVEYMQYFCILYKIPKKEHKAIINRLLSLVGLENALEKKIHTYSKGMIQRLHIARSLINNPKIIFLDEPTIGLDPTGAKMLRNLIKKLKEKGITVILTTHYMNEADELCDRIAFMKDGKIKIIGEPKKIKEESNKNNVFLCIVSINSINDFLGLEEFKVLYSKKIEGDIYEIEIQARENIYDFTQFKNRLNEFVSVLHIKRKEITLEDAYLYFMGSR